MSDELADADPVRITIPTGNEGENESEDDMTPDDYGLLKMHALNGAQRQSDGAGAYIENLRYDYLEGKNMVSQTESLGHRIVTESGSGRTRELTGAAGT